jgi:predicted nucleotidyltransferase
MLDRSEAQSWLTNASVALSRVVVEAHLFGSFLEPEATPSDVDVLIVFREWDARSYSTLLKRQFQSQFGCRLHIQMFHASQVKELVAFLERAGRSRRFV